MKALFHNKIGDSGNDLMTSTATTATAATSADSSSVSVVMGGHSDVKAIDLRSIIPVHHVNGTAKSPFSMAIDIDFGPMDPAIMGGGMRPGSTGSSIQLTGIGRPIETSQAILRRKGKMAGAFSLMTVVPLVAVMVVVTIIAVCLAPMTALWVKSLESLTGTCSDSIFKEMEVYRKLLVEKSITSISTQMSIPPTVASVVRTAIPESAYTSPIPLHNDSSALAMTIRGLAKQFPSINNMIVAWINPQGEHLYGDWKTYWGVFDSNIDSNITMYWFDEDTPTTTRTGEDVTDYDVTTRDWWLVGIKAWNGSWTPVYTSAVASDGRVIAYTLRPRASVPVVIQVTLSISFLWDFFITFNLTTNGESFLVEDQTLKMIAGTPGIPILTQFGDDTFAFSSTDQTVRDATEMWLTSSVDSLVEAHFEMMVDGGNAYVDVVPIKATGGLVMWLFLITPEKDFMGEIEEEQNKTVDRAYFSLWAVLAIEIFIGILAVVTSMTLSLFLARALTAVIRKLQKVSSGKLTKTESNKDLSRSLLKEIDSLNSEVTIMQSALESFSQYVPTQVVRYLCKNHMKPVVGVNKMHCTVMFLDVVDFTHTMEQYGAQTVIEILSTMFESFSIIITKNHGCIDKYIGDAIMALWGCPVADHNAEIHACKAVAEIMADLSRLNAIFKAKSFPAMRIRIGLHAGEVNAGNVGSSQRLNFTVLGNTVNLASRLEPLNKELLTSVLVSDAIRDATAEKLKDTFSWRALGHIQVRGFKAPVLVHEFFGFTSLLGSETKRLLQDYSEVDQMLYKKLSSQMSTPADITEAIDCYLAQNPDDLTVTQARKLLVNLRGNTTYTTHHKDNRENSNNPTAIPSTTSGL